MKYTIKKVEEIIKNGDLNELQYCIQNGFSVNTRLSWGNSLLHNAILYGHLDIIKYLIKQNVQRQMEYGENAFHVLGCSQHFSQEVADYLQAIGEDINMLDHSGKSPLYKAATNGFKQTFLYFLKLGADINLPLGRDCNLLQAAVEGKNIELVQLIADKLPENMKIESIKLALFQSAQKGLLSIFKLLVEHYNADLYARDSIGNSVLHVISNDSIMFKDQQDGIKGLLLYLKEKNIDFNIVNMEEQTPVDYTKYDFISNILKKFGGKTKKELDAIEVNNENAVLLKVKVCKDGTKAKENQLEQEITTFLQELSCTLAISLDVEKQRYSINVLTNNNIPMYLVNLDNETGYLFAATGETLENALYSLRELYDSKKDLSLMAADQLKIE